MKKLFSLTMVILAGVASGQVPAPGAQGSTNNPDLFLTFPSSQYGRGPGVTQKGVTNTAFGQGIIQVGSNTLVVGVNSTDGGLNTVDVFGQNISPTTSFTTYLGSSTNNIKLSGSLISGAGGTNNTGAIVLTGTNGWTNTFSCSGFFYAFATNGGTVLYQGSAGTNAVITNGLSTANGGLITFFLLPGWSVQNSTNCTGRFAPAY